MPILRSLISLKLVLLVGPTKKYNLNVYYINTFFPHAELREDVYAPH